MITSLPAVQHSCKAGWRLVSASSTKWFKASANRRHRRALNQATRRIRRDPDGFYNESFDAPSLSAWSIY